MEENKLQPGPVQKAWLQSLREHPERQLKSSLGSKDFQEDSYKACCLGELLICAHNNGIYTGYQWVGNALADTGPDSAHVYGVLYTSWRELGLRSSNGQFTNYIGGYRNLAEANDGGMTWPQIADLVEANFDKVFTKSF